MQKNVLLHCFNIIFPYFSRMILYYESRLSLYEGISTENISNDKKDLIFYFGMGEAMKI